jgi:hypothetical protein
MKTPYDLGLTPVPGAKAIIDGVEWIGTSSGWERVGQVAPSPHGPINQVPGAPDLHPPYSEELLRQPLTEELLRRVSDPERFLRERLALVRQSTQAVWVDTITGRETPVNSTYMVTREQAEWVASRLRALGVSPVTIEEIEPANPFSRIDYRGDPRRFWYVNGHAVGLLIERYAAYPLHVADQMTLAEFSPGKPVPTMPITGASPPPPKEGSPVSQPVSQPVTQPVNQPVNQPVTQPVSSGGNMRERILRLAQSQGKSTWGWDAWNWFYTEVTGITGPAPEDRGLSRTPTGSVLIDGMPEYDIDTWARWARISIDAPIAGPSTPVEMSTRPMPAPPVSAAPASPPRSWLIGGAALLGIIILYRLMR